MCLCVCVSVCVFVCVSVCRCACVAVYVGVNPVTARFEWTPTVAQRGRFAVCFTAMDFVGLMTVPRCVHMLIGTSAYLILCFPFSNNVVFVALLGAYLSFCRQLVVVSCHGC